MSITSAIMCVQEFIETGHKSMYLMDAWLTITRYVEQHEKEIKKEI